MVAFDWQSSAYNFLLVFYSRRFRVIDLAVKVSTTLIPRSKENKSRTWRGKLILLVFMDGATFATRCR